VSKQLMLDQGVAVVDPACGAQIVQPSSHGMRHGSVACWRKATLPNMMFMLLECCCTVLTCVL
jgi:hypothetical protein